MGIWQLSWLEWFGIAMLFTHVTIISVTVYLHRSQAHRALDIHPALCHVFRLWLWLTTGMTTRDWVAVHRKHHAKVETVEDPHSPVIYGIWTVLLRGVWLYRRAAADPAIIEKYGQGTPNDWLEKYVYSLNNVGVLSMLTVDVVCFGKMGGLLWVVQMLWIPLLAAGVINGIGHHLGYRNFASVDTSRNIVPWGILIGGEELHNNHHAFPRSAKLSVRSFEFDLGYVYIKSLVWLGLAKVNYVMPDLTVGEHSGVKGILNARMSIYREYQKRVMRSAFKCHLKQRVKHSLCLKGIDKLLISPPQLMKEVDKKTLDFVLGLDEQLAKVYEFQLRLYRIFYDNRGGDLMGQVKLWCSEARESGQKTLEDFAVWIEEHFVVAMAKDV